MKKPLPLFLFSLIAFYLSSCWHPPFDPLVSASELTADKLGAPVWSKTVTLRDDAAGGYYLPGRDPAYYGTGTWINKVHDIILAGTFSPANQSEFFYNFFTRNDLGDMATILSPLSPPNPTTGQVLIGANKEITANGIVMFNGSSTPIFSAMIADAIGCGTAPHDASFDYLAVMSWPALDPAPKICFLPIDGSTTAIDPILHTYTLPANPPARPTGPVFTAFKADTNYLYASSAASSGFVTFRWLFDSFTSSFPDAPLLLPITRQLTGILSDGRLLADTGDRLYVYSADGTDGFMIPTGVLRFVHERTPDGITWISVFTRTVQIPGGKSDDGSEYLIEIYEIPTLKLRELAE